MVGGRPPVYPAVASRARPNSRRTVNFAEATAVPDTTAIEILLRYTRNFNLYASLTLCLHRQSLSKRLEWAVEAERLEGMDIR